MLLDKLKKIFTKEENNETPKPMLPKGLENLRDKENGTLEIISLHYYNRDGVLDVNFHVIDDSERRVGNWTVTISKVKDRNISLYTERGIELLSDHYILRFYTKPYNHLYFKKGANDPHALIGDLFAEHQKYFPSLTLNTFLNPDLSLLDSCRAGSGLFATGPHEILDVYKTCLERHGKEPYYTSPDGQIPHKGLQILFLGNSYFIGEQFEFTEQPLYSSPGHKNSKKDSD